MERGFEERNLIHKFCTSRRIRGGGGGYLVRVYRVVMIGFQLMVGGGAGCAGGICTRAFPIPQLPLSLFCPPQQIPSPHRIPIASSSGPSGPLISIQRRGCLPCPYEMLGGELCSWALVELERFALEAGQARGYRLEGLIRTCEEPLFVPSNSHPPWQIPYPMHRHAVCFRG